MKNTDANRRIAANRHIANCKRQDKALLAKIGAGHTGVWEKQGGFAWDGDCMTMDQVVVFNRLVINERIRWSCMFGGYVVRNSFADLASRATDVENTWRPGNNGGTHAEMIRRWNRS